MPAPWLTSDVEASRAAHEPALSSDDWSSASNRSYSSSSNGSRGSASSGSRRRRAPSSSTAPARRAPRYGYDWTNYDGPAVVNLQMVEAASGVYVLVLSFDAPLARPRSTLRERRTGGDASRERRLRPLSLEADSANASLRPPYPAPPAPAHTSSPRYYTMPVKLGGTTYNLQPDTGSSDLVRLLPSRDFPSSPPPPRPGTERGQQQCATAPLYEPSRIVDLPSSWPIRRSSRAAVAVVTGAPLACSRRPQQQRGSPDPPLPFAHLRFEQWVAGNACKLAACTNVQLYTPVDSETAHDAVRRLTFSPLLVPDARAHVL